MSKKEKFECELRKFRRRWFPTKKEKEEIKNFTKNLIRAGQDIDFYINVMLKKG